jgi:acyl carrier protein
MIGWLPAGLDAIRIIAKVTLNSWDSAGMIVDLQSEILRALDESLGLDGRAQSFSQDTPLFGSLAELDSMAVVDLMTALEERFGVVIEDDEINGRIFATVGALTAFMRSKLPS